MGTGRFCEGLLVGLLFLLFWVSLQFGGTLMKAVAIFSTVMWCGLIAAAMWLVLFKGAKPSVIEKAKTFGRSKSNKAGEEGNADER